MTAIHAYWHVTVRTAVGGGPDVYPCVDLRQVLLLVDAAHRRSPAVRVSVRRFPGGRRPVCTDERAAALALLPVSAPPASGLRAHRRFDRPRIRTGARS